MGLLDKLFGKQKGEEGEGERKEPTMTVQTNDIEKTMKMDASELARLAKRPKTRQPEQQSEEPRT